MINKGIGEGTVGQKQQDQKKRFNKRKPQYLPDFLMQEVSYNLNMKDNLASLSSPQDNRSPSTNCSEQSQENQIDVFEEMMRRERERKEMSKVMAGTHGLHDLGKEISGIAQQREFSSTDYELLLQLDEHESTQKQKEIYQGLDEDTINSLKYWKVHKKKKE